MLVSKCILVINLTQGKRRKSCSLYFCATEVKMRKSKTQGSKMHSSCSGDFLNSFFFPSGHKRYLNFCTSSRKGLWLTCGNEYRSHQRSKNGRQTAWRGTAWGGEQGLDGLERLVLACQPCQWQSRHTTGVHDHLQGVATPNTKTDITERQDGYSVACVTRPVSWLWKTLLPETLTGIVSPLFYFFILHACFFLSISDFLKETLA